MIEAKRTIRAAALLAILLFPMLFSGCWTSREEKQLLLARPHYEAGMAYYREGKTAQAREEILAALEEFSAYVPAHIQYQVIRAGEVKAEKLLSEYDRLLKQNQGDARFHYLYGRLLSELEKQEAVYNRAVELNEESPWGYFGLGWVAFKRSDYELALDNFEKCIELDPENPLFHNDLGGVYYFMGMYDEAIAELSLAREINPLYPTPYLNLATAYYQRGDFDMAVEMLEEYVRLAPAAEDVPEMRRKLVQLRGK